MRQPHPEHTAQGKGGVAEDVACIEQEYDMAAVLIVDDDTATCTTLQFCLEKVGHDVATAESAAKALQRLQNSNIDVVVADIILPGESGIELLKSIHRVAPTTRVIMMTGDPFIENAAEAIRNGACDYLLKPVTNDQICRAVETAAQVKAIDDHCRQLEAEKRDYQQDLEQLVARRTQELQASNDQLSETVEKLRDACATIHKQERLFTLTQLASGIAHDFNNALMPILGLTDHLLQEMKSSGGVADHIELLEIIMASATDAKSIVQRLQDFYKPPGASAAESVSLCQLVDDVVQTTAPAWLGEGKSIRVNNEIGAVPDVSINASQMTQLLTNLLLNAAQSIRKKGVISFDTVVDMNRVTLNVRDNGCGMSPETAAVCMEPFFTTNGQISTGLGLAMCDNIARQHGGKVSIESWEGRGTRVSVSLPVATSAPAPEPDHASPDNLRVLVIDDDDASLKVFEKYLSAEGHETETFLDPESGLDRLKSAPFDVVMTDRAMMKMTGDVVATRAKRISPEVPVILVTGFGDMINARGLKIPGVDLVVSKPVSRETLRNALATVLKDRHGYLQDLHVSL